MTRWRQPRVFPIPPDTPVWTGVDQIATIAEAMRRLAPLRGNDGGNSGDVEDDDA